MSDDAESYTQYYDHFEKLSQKSPTNKTLLLLRDRNDLVVASSLDYIASPQSNGWLYLGQARYFEPKPRDRNEELDKKEQDGWLKNFGFDYSRIWVTDIPAKIPAVQSSLVRKTKLKIDKEYKSLPVDEREYHRNITDYEKISWVSDGYYIIDGYWSLIFGGAAWFQARENSRLVALSSSRLSGNLLNWVSKERAVAGFAEYFKTEYDDCNKKNGSKYDCIWKHWQSDLNQNHPSEPASINVLRSGGQTKLMGNVLVDGNRYRSFLEKADFGQIPKALASYDNPKIDFEKFKALYPELIDVFVSPNQNMVILLTKNEFVLIDVLTRSEQSRTKHNILFNKVVMVEWATNAHVDRWRNTLKRQY
ncbi:MAG TPA: hypothetical protein PKA82_00035 [Pyrinomonadaceae bacterium]|nr:hypothetical protein [Pyrinomonadaceae bacterium]